MDNGRSQQIAIVSFVIGFFIATLLFILFPGEKVCNRCANNNSIMPCDCTINYNGSNVSVEDALDLAGEGLTMDQTDEVKELIEEYCSK